MKPEALVRIVEDFLVSASDAVVMEEGVVAFDLANAKYSVSGEHNKCLLHLWSAERNVVRRVLDVEIKNDVLRLAVQRLGQARPTKLEIRRLRNGLRGWRINACCSACWSGISPAARLPSLERL